MHGDAMRVLSSVFITGQSDTKSREYLISWLEKLLFESGTFSEVLRTSTFWKEIACLLYKSLLPFLTFVDCKGPLKDFFTTFDHVLILCLRD